MSVATRAAAARVIAATVHDGVSLREALPTALATLAPPEHGLLRQLCYGTLRSYHRLLPIINSRLRRPLKAKDSDIQALMLCGLYQLVELRTPDHAAISTAVEACRKLDKSWATGLVNGVLRSCTRRRETLYDDLSAAELDSHPDWLYQLIQQHWPAQAAQIVAANNRQPPMYLRVNRRLIGRDDYLKKLRRQEPGAATTDLSPVAIRLDKGVDVAALPGFCAGEVSVQDESAQLAALLLDSQPGDRILDACCAPGGKTCHILESQPELEALVACDIDGRRLLRVRENLERLQLSASLAQMDATALSSDFRDGSFDRVLVDAPCSGSGVIRRHPDIKLLRRGSDISPLADIQEQILAALWRTLKPGGTLLYVTCSILAEENDAVVAKFLKRTPSANCEPIEQPWGIACAHGRQILPDPDGSDGLYFSRLGKTGQGHFGIV